MAFEGMEEIDCLKGKMKWIKIQTVKKELAIVPEPLAPAMGIAALAWSITGRRAGRLTV
ncbi:MAG: hypothetical protein HFJ85_06775 [Oscillospiraceae bacterium]|nr:hypothetical protein [Oscillospiraceae bacterium]